MKRQCHIAQGRHKITLPAQLYRENQTQNQFIWNKCKFIFVKLLGGWSYRRTFSDPLRVLCPCKIQHNPRRSPPPSSRHRVIFSAIKHNLAQGMFCVSMPELPQPHSNLLTILTGQDHISKVVVFCQVSKSSTLPLIFAKYFIWKIKGATQTHKISLW